jgi:uncharacterized protein (UPF0212 family)
MRRNQSSSRSTSVNQSVVNAYQRSLQARSIWAGFASSLRNSKTSHERDDAHAILHAATMYYFEATQPYLGSAPSGSQARDFWERAPLWPVEQITQPGVKCGEGHQYAEADAAGQNCPECGGTLQAASVPTESGAHRWLCGLRHLQSFVDETEEVTVDAGRWEVGTTTKQVPQRLDGDVLLRCSRYLDEAASDLGLLADVDEERPRAEVI